MCVAATVREEAKGREWKIVCVVMLPCCSSSLTRERRGERRVFGQQLQRELNLGMMHKGNGGTAEGRRMEEDERMKAV